MKLYIDANGVYVATQAEAKHNGKGWHQVDVPTTDGRQALADYLNAVRWSEQNITANTPLQVINEAGPVTEEMVDKLLTVTPASSYSAQSINLDEQWEKLPLARKLHFAALAMEDARAQL